MRSSNGRSPLYRWMRLHHDWFAARIADTRPDWQALAEGFSAKLGLRTADGKALNKDQVRHTWWRVRRDVRTARANRREPGTPAVRLVAPLSAGPPPPAKKPAAPQGGDGHMARIWAQANERSGRKADG